MIDQSDAGAWIAAVLLLDLILASAAAMSAGRALARAWRSFAIAPLYMVPLAAALGFLHYAIFGLSPIPLYDIGAALALLPGAPTQAIVQLASDCAFWAGLSLALTGYAFVGYRLTRRRQMTERYHWAFERAGLWSWRERAPS
jgi:hypothetical protein